MTWATIQDLYTRFGDEFVDKLADRRKWDAIIQAYVADQSKTNRDEVIQTALDDAGVKYLGNLFKQFGDWSLALAAYNAGPGNVTKYGGIPPFPETQQYVAKITQDVGLTTDETPTVGNSEVGTGTVVTLGMTLALAVIGWLVVRS